MGEVVGYLIGLHRRMQKLPTRRINRRSSSSRRHGDGKRFGQRRSIRRCRQMMSQGKVRGNGAAVLGGSGSSGKG